MTQSDKPFAQWISADVPSIRFPANNKMDIPDLDLAFQAQVVTMPVIAYGSVKRGSVDPQGKPTLHFYVDDQRFRALYANPAPILNSGVQTMCEVNYSLHSQTLTYAAVWMTGQKRWISRMMQHLAGIRIMVDLNVAPYFAALNLAGVPKGWRAFSTRGYNDRIAEIETEAKLAENIAGTSDFLLCVVGGGHKISDVCKSRGWVHIPEYADRVMPKGAQNRAKVSENA